MEINDIELEMMELELINAQINLSFKADSKCPRPTRDIALNLANRKKAIDKASYGPLNPEQPNEDYWKKLAAEWDVDVAESKKQRCGNCAVFIVTPEMKSCIESGLDPENSDEWDAIDSAGQLGYCEAFDFKCASKRTCRAWVTGGPIKTNTKSDEMDISSLPAFDEYYAEIPVITKGSKNVDVKAAKVRLKDPKGGLTAAGRAYFKRTQGANLKPGVRGPANTPEKMRRKGSFLTRFFTNPSGPMKDEKGRPTRLALSAAAWGEPVPQDMESAAKLAAKGRRLLDRYERSKKKK